MSFSSRSECSFDCQYLDWGNEIVLIVIQVTEDDDPSSGLLCLSIIVKQ